jgi:gamma-glutamylcyclotransferase
VPGPLRLRQLYARGSDSCYHSGMKYFAYGSNLLPERLLARTPLAKLLTTAVLSEHQLCFHKRGGDRSGKCDALYTGDPAHRVYGVIYEISASERRTLDQIEGPGYRTVDRVVSTPQGELEAFLYQAVDPWVDKSLLPFDWYREFVLQGARLHGFERAYVETIETVSVTSDPDPVRRKQNIEILARISVQSA